MSVFAFHTASNYVGTEEELNGCINDYNLIIKSVDDYFNIPSNNRWVYLGDDYKRDVVIEDALALPDILEPGDTLVYTNSSHGVQLATSDSNEDDGFDEALYTNDCQFILDDEIHYLLTKFKPGVRIIAEFDNCHAGTMDRSLIRNNVHQMMDDVVCDAIFYLGCKEHQTSADAWIKHHGFYGALTWHLIKALVDSKYSISYIDLLNKTNELLSANKYEQVAQLAYSKNVNLNDSIIRSVN